MPRRTLYLLPTYKVGCSKLKYQAGGDCAEKALSTALCGLKAQQVPSPGQRPGCHCPHSLRPVRAKVKANRSPILLPLQGVGVYTLIPRALPWAKNWLPFQGARGEDCTAAPERGPYSRIGARPYLPPQLINSRCCPCKVGCSKSRKNPMLKLRDFGLVKLLAFNA